MKYTPTIGLEIHAELDTITKMFCDCLNDEQEIEPNKNICPVCAGHPGALPKANKKAIDLVIKTGLALNCKINSFSKFDRKNYFYPDLPKAYQITQYDLPLCENGKIELPDSGKIAEITRIHLEEDTAGLAHSNGEDRYTLVDFNRSGIPLMELVTEPCFSSAEEVIEFAKEFQLILRYLGVSDGDMEKGHLRFEANISVAPENKSIDSVKDLGTKVEVKNLNSFESVYKSINYEIDRQAKELNRGNKITQETRGWDGMNKTFSQRSKENAHDYRYFPEPDLPPMKFTDDDIKIIRASIPELPKDKRQRLSSEYNLSKDQVSILIKDLLYSNFFESAVSELRSFIDAPDIDLVYNYLISDIKGIEKEFGIYLNEAKINPHMLAHTVYLIQQKKISSRSAKDTIKESFLNGVDPENFIKEHNLFEISDENEIGSIVDSIIEENRDVWKEYINQKDNAVQFLIGKVMSKTKGKANPSVVINLFKQKRDEHNRRQ